MRRRAAAGPSLPTSGRLPDRPWRRAGGYALAVLATGLALAARFALDPLLPPTGFPFLTFFPAVVLTALFGGLGPGLLAAALSIAAAKGFYIQPLGSFRFASAADAIALGFFAAVLLVDCVVIHLMTTSLARVRRSRAELAASEARFRALSDATREGVVIHDGGIIAEANDAFWRMHGFASREAVIGRGVMELIAPAGRAAVAESIRQRSAEPYESLGLRPDGTSFPIEVEGRVIEYQGHPMRVAIARDLTRRKASEAAAAAREARLRDLVATLDLGAFMIRDPGGTIRFWSKGCERLYGWTAEEAVGQVSHALLRTAAPMPHEAIEPPREGWDEWTGDLRQRTRDGREVIVAARKVLRRDATGQPGSVLEILADVTAERRAEAALAASEERLRLAIEGTGLATWDSDLATGTATWTANQFGMLGYPPDPSGRATTAMWRDRILPEDWPAVAAAHRAAMPGTQPFRIAYRIRRADDGALRWIETVGRCLDHGPDGAPRSVIGVNLDITERRDAGAALAESEARLRVEAERVDLALRAGAILGTWDWDLPTDRFTVDERFAESFGIDPGLGRTGLSLAQVIAAVHPDELAGLQAAIAEAIARGGAYSHEYRVRGRDGVFRWIEANGRVDHAPDGTPLRFPGVLVDAERRRAAEEKLREGEARLRLALEAGGMGFWSWDLRTDQLEWDARQFELFGLDPARGQPSGEDTLSTVHPADLPGLTAAIRQAVEAGDGAFGHEFRVVHADGLRWLAGHGHAAPGPDGRAARMVGLNFDITARREAEAVLAREAAELDRLAEERGRALAAIEARLAEAARMEALGRLAGGIAHDFNNVLQAVQGGIALASKRLPAEAEAVRKYLSLAAEAAGRGAAVTGRLLSFARRGELTAEPVEPGALLEGLADFLRPVLGAKVALRVAAPAGLPPLLADRAQLEAVLVNLANNARDAMPAGGLLEFSAEALAVPGAAQVPPGLVPGAYLRLAVRDAGDGMPAEILARVSEPFFTTKPRGQGTGLGLAMARGFAEQSGGGLAIESEPGCGTTVSVWLPQVSEGAASQAAAQDDAAPDAAMPAGGVTILLAEDKEAVRTVLAAQLQEHGCIVWAVEDAAAAAALLADGLRPDVLVTDLSMPGAMDGLDLLARARMLLPRLPAVLVTGHAGDAGPGRLEDAERGGPFALLRKPAAPAALFDRLARVLRQAGNPGLRAAP